MSTSPRTKTAPSAVIAGPIPETAHSSPVVLEPYGVERIPTYNYIQEEYFVSGTAAGQPYQTRILVRRPENIDHFNGKAVAEVAHIWGGTSVWRVLNRHLMRNGYMWIEIDSQSPSALGLIAGSNPERYRSMTFIKGPLASDFAATIPFVEDPNQEELAKQYDEFKEKWWEATPQSFEIIAQVAQALRTGLPDLQGSEVTGLYFIGISQTGGVVRRFVEQYHSQFRNEDGRPVFDGYLPAASGGPSLPDIDVPVIEMLGEAEFQSVRWECGVSGQVRGLSHRRPDSSTFRLYEVPGMAHRETRYMSDKDKIRLKDCPLPAGAYWSTFPNSHVYNAIFEQLVAWSEGIKVPPPSQYLETVGTTDTIVRDEHGNALGGWRTTYTDVPHSTLVAATPVGRPSWYHGNETPFDSAKLSRLYGSPAGYRHEVAKNLQELIENGFYLEVDAEDIRLQAESVQW
ncbi:hypothetical protein M1D51_19545 [Arthrobacter sp. R3-55]